MQNKIIENLNTKNKTLKYTFNIEKSEISENNFGLKFIGSIAKNPLRNEFKEKILEEIENEKKFFDENIGFKINDFVGIKKGKEFQFLCDLVFQKSDFFLDKKNICEFKNDYFVTFPNRLIQISPVFGLEKISDDEKIFSNLRKNFLENLDDSGKIFYEKILDILEKNIGKKLENISEIIDFFTEFMVTQENVDKKLLEIYEDELLDSVKIFSQNNGKNIFNQKIEIGYNSDKNYFLILDGTHRFKAFLNLLKQGKILISDLNNFDFKFENSLISCEKNISEISEDGNFSGDILKDEKISEVVKKIYLNK